MTDLNKVHIKHIVTAGKPLAEAKKVLIMLHGRGAGADDILSMASYFNLKDFALLAPEATTGSWYPYSFMAPQNQNEPWLSSALTLIENLVKDVTEQGIKSEHIYFLGFSQGACLTLEFVARNAKKYGGVVAFTGGLIGDTINEKNYQGDLESTPIFIGTSNPDPHVPVERVHASTTILKQLNGSVTEKVYANLGHTINADEISLANSLIFNSAL